MHNLNLKSFLVLFLLVASWATIIWIQWESTVTPQIGMLAVPSVMILVGLLAGIALHQDE